MIESGKASSRSVRPDGKPAPPSQAVFRRCRGAQRLSGQVDDVGIAGGVDGTALQPSTGVDQHSTDLVLNAAPLRFSGKAAVAASSFKAFVQQGYANLNAADGDVLVVRGKWDHAEHLLQESGIPFDAVSAGAIAKAIARARVVILNCPAELRDGDIEAIKQFVEAGGYLLSTDWSLNNSLERMFPGYLLFKGAYAHSGVVDAVAVADNSFVRGLTGVLPWSIDDKSEIAELSGRLPVHVLVRSRALSAQDPSALGILAATFDVGRGKVLHLVGHFDNGGHVSGRVIDDPSPVIGISSRQAVALNFICERLSAK